MSTKTPLVVSFKPDLRTAKGTRIQKGFFTKILRVVTLILLDVISLTIAWKLAVFYGTPIESPWTEKSSFLLLIITVEIGIIAAKGLYQAGRNRRNYPSLLVAVSMSELFLLLIAFLYEPNNLYLALNFSTVLVFVYSPHLYCSPDL